MARLHAFPVSALSQATVQPVRGSTVPMGGAANRGWIPECGLSPSPAKTSAGGGVTGTAIACASLPERLSRRRTPDAHACSILADEHN